MRLFCPYFEILYIWVLAFSTNFVLLKSDLSGTNTNWPQTSGLQNLNKMDHFGIFNENVNVARFARNVECDFFSDFQTLCKCN